MDLGDHNWQRWEFSCEQIGLDLTGDTIATNPKVSTGWLPPIALRHGTLIPNPSPLQSQRQRGPISSIRFALWQGKCLWLRHWPVELIGFKQWLNLSQIGSLHHLQHQICCPARIPIAADAGRTLRFQIDPCLGGLAP